MHLGKARRTVLAALLLAPAPPQAGSAAEPPPPAVVAALQAGEPVDVLVEFESLSLDGECLAMARAAGRHHLGAAELPYRRSGLAALKQNVTSEVAGVSILHDHENLASAWMRIESEAALLQATGVPITDDRLDPPRVTPRVDLFAALDSDGDGILFPFDNCSDKNEPLALCDADEDGFGNPCDCDIGPNGGNGACTTDDIDPFKDALTAGDPVADIDCSGAATTDDIPLFKTLLTEPQRPGPSGLPCAGEPPCN